MTKQTQFDFCVVGAGATGLTVCYELLKGGASVLLIERDDRIGGLAKSHEYGGHVFDTGPKRFHTDDPIVISFLEEVARDSMLKIPRSTEVHFANRYFEWPLRLQDVWRMPLSIAIPSVLDLLKKKTLDDPISFHQYIRSRYGETLYNVFFAPYTKKFLRWDVEDIHSDWASTGINRTVVDSRINSNTSLDLIKGVLLPSKVKTEFLYPGAGGFGGFYEQLYGLCQASDRFQVVLGERLAELHQRPNGVEGVTDKGTPFTCGDLVWSGNLNDLSRMIGSDNQLPYLNTVFYNVICRDKEVLHKGSQWIYVSDGRTLMSRITCMKEFADYTCPEGYYNFVCEVTDSQRNPLYFAEPDKLIDTVQKELYEMKFMKKVSSSEAVYVNPVRDTYPIYHRGYLKQFASTAGNVKKFSKNITLVGRCGAFWYNNSDHSIRFALETAKKLLGRAKGDGEFDYRGYFGGVHGRAATPVGA